jgi:hypothetical protein
MAKSKIVKFDRHPIDAGDGYRITPAKRGDGSEFFRVYHERSIDGISDHETAEEARAAITRYKAADRRRADPVPFR